MTAKQWLQIRVEATLTTLAAIAAAMERLGCQGVELQDSPLVVVGYLPEEHQARLASFATHLEHFPDFGLPAVPPPQVTLVKAESWQKGWRRFFRSRRIGARIRVQPNWSKCRPQPGEIVIYLDPGLAFGTGSHPTTALCLELLQVYLRSGDRVADLGTGTGILAIAAAKLGAREVWAVDNDPLAVLVAQENIQNNRVAHQVRVVQGEGWQGLQGKFDLVLCNILSSFLVQTAPQVPLYLEENGLYLVSGVIHQNWREVEHALQSVGLQVVELRKRKQWVAAVYQKR